MSNIITTDDFLADGWGDRECHFCGKRICIWIKCYHDNMAYSPRPNAPEIEAVTLSWSRTLYLCPECYAKYRDELTQTLNEAFDKWDKKTLEATSKLRDNVEKMKEIQRKKDIKEQIDRLNKELQELKK